MSILVKDCTNCLFCNHHRGHGENWHECRHPDSPGGYDNIIQGGNTRSRPLKMPNWCPLKSGETVIKIIETENE
jgi:hypothetical protein